MRQLKRTKQYQEQVMVPGPTQLVGGWSPGGSEKAPSSDPFKDRREKVVVSSKVSGKSSNQAVLPSSFWILS